MVKVGYAALREKRMDYLYFDIECCDGNHICSFGYVLADEKFCIARKDDILMDPQMPFKLGRDNFDPSVKLAYTEDEFRRHAPFKEVYPKIHELLSAPARRLLGHSVASDIKYLNTACERYGVPKIDIIAYYTQKIYKQVARDKDMSKLESIMEKLSVDISHLAAHKSCDDAEMTMLAVKAMCDRNSCSVEQLLSAHADCVVDREKMAIAELDSKVNKAIKNLKRYYKESRDWERFRLSDGFKLLYADKLERLTEYIFRTGYALTVNGTRFDYYVADNKTADDEIPEEVKIIGTSEFLKMIDVQITDDGELKVGDDDGSSNAFKRFFEQAASCSDKKIAHCKNRR